MTDDQRTELLDVYMVGNDTFQVDFMAPGEPLSFVFRLNRPFVSLIDCFPQTRETREMARDALAAVCVAMI